MKNIFKILRIICCVVCVAILAVSVFIFVYLGTFWGLISVLAAAIFGVLMIAFKIAQEDYEKKHPAADSDEAQTEDNEAVEPEAETPAPEVPDEPAESEEIEEKPTDDENE